MISWSANTDVYSTCFAKRKRTEQQQQRTKVTKISKIVCAFFVERVRLLSRWLSFFIQFISFSFLVLHSLISRRQTCRTQNQNTPSTPSKKCFAFISFVSVNLWDRRCVRIVYSLSTHHLLLLLLLIQFEVLNCVYNQSHCILLVIEHKHASIQWHCDWFIYLLSLFICIASNGLLACTFDSKEKNIWRSRRRRIKTTKQNYCSVWIIAVHQRNKGIAYAVCIALLLCVSIWRFRIYVDMKNWRFVWRR